MGAEVDAALWDVEVTFVAHTPRGSGAVAPRPVPRHSPGRHRPDVDVSAWVLALGVTVGDAEDVRALTPWLLAEAVRGDRVDLHTVLTRIAGFWADWSPAETGAVRNLVDALWCDVLDTRPGPESTATAVAFLDAAGGLGDPADRLLAIWDWRQLPGADHHLAELVVDAFYGARVDPAVLAWAIDAPQRDRLRRALARDAAEPWAGDLAAAVDLLPT